MQMEEIKPNIVLRNKITGQIGVLYEGYDYGMCKPEEAPIIYRDDDKKASSPHFVGTDVEVLEKYELIPEDKLTIEHLNSVCKSADGAGSYRYLVAGADGIECARIKGDMTLALQIDGKVRNGIIGATAINCGGRYGNLK